MVDTVLPKELRLGVPPKMPQARTYMFRQQSTLQSYTYGQTITINIPRLQRSYLRKDSYLRFRLNGYFTAPDGVQSLVLDTAGAWGLFEKLEVFDYLGSTVLESISGKPQLMSLLLDLGLKEIIDKNVGTSIAGLESDYCVNGDLPFKGSDGNAANVTAVTSNVTMSGFIRPPNSGIALVPGTTSTVPVVVSTAAAAGTGITAGGQITLTGTPASGTAAGSVVVFTNNGGTTQFTTNTQYYIAATPIPTSTVFYLANTPGGTAMTTVTANTGAASMIIYGKGPAFNFSREFSIPMLSFLGMLSEKMVPLHNGYTIVLTVANQKKPMYLSQPFESTVGVGTTTQGANATSWIRQPTTNIEPTPPEWNISDVYMQCQILELGPVAESMILSSTQGNPLVVHTKAFRNYVSTVKGASWTGNTLNSTGQQEFVMNLNLNVASLTNVLWIMRPTNQTDSLLYPSTGARTRNMLQRWQFQYGSTTLPQNNGIQCMAQTSPTYPIGSVALNNTSTYVGYSVGFSECFQELVKARPVYLPANRFHLDGYPIDSVYNTNLDNRAGLGVAINILNWKNLFPSKDSWQSLPRFAAGLNLQLANNKSDMISGLNTNGMNTSIRGLFHPLYTDFMNGVTVDAFCEYDAFVNISPGIATTVSF